MCCRSAVTKKDEKKPEARATPLQEAILKSKIARADADHSDVQSKALYEAAKRPLPSTEKQMEQEVKGYKKLVEAASKAGDHAKKEDAIAELAAAEARVDQRRHALAAAEDATTEEAELEKAKFQDEEEKATAKEAAAAAAEDRKNRKGRDDDGGVLGSVMSMGGLFGGDDKAAAKTKAAEEEAEPTELTPIQRSAKEAEEASVSAKWALSAADSAEAEAQEMYESSGKPYPRTLKKAEKELEQAQQVVARAKPAERNHAAVELAQAQQRVDLRRKAEAIRTVAKNEVVLARNATAVVRAEERAVTEAKAVEEANLKRMAEAEEEAVKYLESFGPQYENMEIFELKVELKRHKLAEEGTKLELQERLCEHLDKEPRSLLPTAITSLVPVPSPHSIGIGGAKKKNEKYGGVEKPDLKAELEKRGLDTKGNKEAMEERLTKNDRVELKKHMAEKAEEFHVPEGVPPEGGAIPTLDDPLAPGAAGAAAGLSPEELARRQKEEDLERVIKEREQRAADREKREEEREKRAIEREEREAAAAADAETRRVAKAQRRAKRVQKGEPDEESAEEEEPELDEPAEAISPPAKNKKKKKKTRVEKMQAAVLPEQAGAESDSSSSDEEVAAEEEGEEEEQGMGAALLGSVGLDVRKERSTKNDDLFGGPAKPRFTHNPAQLAGVDGGMRMTALCEEPVRAECYRGANHQNNYMLRRGETFEFITMKTDEQGTKRLNVITRDGTKGWIRAKAAHTRPRYRVVQDKVKVRDGQEKHSAKVGQLEKGMIVTCAESTQEYNIVQEGRKKGQSVEQTRVRFELDSVSGWASVKARDGKVLLDLMGI